MRLIRACASAFCIAFSTYSRLPAPQAEWTEESRRLCLCFFPLVGAVIGAALHLWLLLCGQMRLGPMLRGGVGAILPLAISGGIHMDGFMDTLDALASCQGREKKLAILKDSRAGAFAVMGCAGCLLLLSALLSEARAERGAAIGCVFAASRALSAGAAVSLPPARPEGMLRGVSTGGKWPVLLCSGGYLLGCILIWALSIGWIWVLCAALALLLTAYFCRMALSQFGGITGDLCGWYSQTLEVVLLAVVVIGGNGI